MSKSLFFSCVLLLLVSFSYAQNSTQNCSTYKFQDKTFVSCLDLHVLNSSIYWTYDESSNVIDMAFRMGVKTKDRWVAWAINPTSKHMIGCQSFIALTLSDGSLKAHTSPVKNYDTILEPGNLSFRVFNVSAMAYESEMLIFAEFELPVNATNVNHLWQEGPVVNNVPGMHAVTGANVRSGGTLNFMSGKSMPVKRTKDSRIKMKIAHGVLNTVSWGIMMPIGVIIARYVKVFAPASAAWFYLHITCQMAAYAIGIAGGAMGFVLGRRSPGIQYSSHKNIGIALFVLASLQILAIRLRPDKEHKYRFYWNIYHRSVGYATIVLGIINIFKGFTIMNATTWSFAYIILISILAFICVVLEVSKWYMIWKTRSRSSNDAFQEIPV